MFGAYTGSSILYCLPGSLRIIILLFSPRNTVCWLVVWDFRCSCISDVLLDTSQALTCVWLIFLLRPSDQDCFAFVVCASVPLEPTGSGEGFALFGYSACALGFACACVWPCFAVRSCHHHLLLDFGLSTCCFACSVLDYYHHSLAPYFKY